MPHIVKSCGKAHAWCRECDQDASEALSEAMLGNINQVADELDAKTQEALRGKLVRRRVPREERRKAIQRAREEYFAAQPLGQTHELGTYQRA